MTDFLKYWTIINSVWQIVNNFISAGGPAVNREVVTNEVSKDLNRKVEAGYLPKDVLDGHLDVIKQALDYHPAVSNK